MPASAIYLDDANTRIPVPTETGNLIVHLPGQRQAAQPAALMFMTHMDTVPLCAGAKPKLAGRKIVNTAKTALGGDNRTGCGVLVTLAAELAKQKLDHPPLTLLFCVREESGLYGARFVDKADLGGPVMAFNYDGGSASNVVVGAVGADRWEVEIFGRASHAGVAPERGISSTMILALALAEVKKGGWFGKVVKGKKQGTSNVGPVTGGRRPARGRRHQCRHRLRARARRKPQPRREILQGDHRRLQGRVREGREGRSRTATARRAASSSRRRPTITRSA